MQLIITYMKRTYLGNILVAIDQLFNALAAGDADGTISARLGYLQAKRPDDWTDFLAEVVDMTFFPVDGEGHCRQAYEKDESEAYLKGNDTALAILSLFVLIGCGILWIPVRIYACVQ